MKPAYRIPSTAEILATSTSGLRVASTFSGCGGTCLGYRWAGFETVYASEFVEAARQTYAANFPGVPIDPRDVRDVTGSSILELAGLPYETDLDVLEGSPPCASFSTAGRRDQGWGQERAYSDTRQRVDDLLLEFARLVAELRPRAFSAENVAGLTRGVSKGHFLDWLDALRAAGYRVASRLLDASWLGVPQTRVRVFVVGVREDLGLEPRFPDPLPYRYSVRDAIGDLSVVVERHSGKTFDVATGPDDPAPPVTTTGLGTGWRSQYRIEEASALGPAVRREYDKLNAGEQSERYRSLVRPDVEEPSPTVTAIGGTPAAAVAHPSEPRKFSIAELRRICGFPDDFVLTGSYAQQWERLGRAVPPPMARAVALSVRSILEEADR